jgi:hypothetical protein
VTRFAVFLALVVAIAVEGTAGFAAELPPHDEPALTAPAIDGEIMDTAVEHCRRGERDQALAMFAAIRTQLEPPPGILDLIRRFEATGCDLPVVAGRGELRVSAGGGWDSNVSQGINARTLTLGSGENTLDLTLDPSYRPRSSAFTHLEADYTIFVPGPQLGLQVAVGLRKNFSAPEFDLGSFSGAATREWRLGPGTLRAQVEMSQLFLGGNDYLRGDGISAQYLVATDDGPWLGTLSRSRTHYVTQANQDARTTEVGVRKEHRVWAATSVHVGAGLLRDEAAGARPGGDRRGWEAAAGLVTFAHGWRLQPEIAYTSWNSAELFAPGLIDLQRRNRLRQASIQAERPVALGTSLLLEWRGRWASDPVVLYRYQAQLFTLTVQHRF